MACPINRFDWRRIKVRLKNEERKPNDFIHLAKIRNAPSEIHKALCILSVSMEMEKINCTNQLIRKYSGGEKFIPE